MTQYAVIDKATGEEVYRYEADAPIEWNEWEFATHDHVPVVEQAPIVSGTPEPRYGGRRDWLATVFCQPVYEAWLEEAVAIGRIRAPGFFADPAYRRAWSGALWTGDGPGSIDPNKEISAAIDRIDAGVSTLAAESLLYDGVDWETKNRQRAREVAARRAAGVDNVAAPEIHNHVAAAPAPVVQQDIHVQPAAAPVVENHVAVHVPEAAAAPSDAVRKIEIVSMPGIAVEALPDRQTTSEVERDAAGDIVSTRQTERDA